MPKIENEYLLQDLVELSVANFYCYDEKTGLEYYDGTLESHELTVKADTEDVKGGQNNDTLYSIDKSKEMSLKITSVFTRQDIQSLKLGGKIADVGTALVDAFHMPKNYTLKNDGTTLYIELDEVPKAGQEVAIYNHKNGKKLVSSDITIDPVDNKKYEIATAGLSEGDSVFVTGFKYQAKATDKYADIASNSSAPVLFTVIEVPLFNADTEIIAYKQFIFPRTKMDGSVTLNGKTEKSKSTDETTIKILKDKSVDYLGRMVYRMA
jgi:hypothetical protein